MSDGRLIKWWEIQLRRGCYLVKIVKVLTKDSFWSAQEETAHGFIGILKLPDLCPHGGNTAIREMGFPSCYSSWGKKKQAILSSFGWIHVVKGPWYFKSSIHSCMLSDCSYLFLAEIMPTELPGIRSIQLFCKTCYLLGHFTLVLRAWRNTSENLNTNQALQIVKY